MMRDFLFGENSIKHAAIAFGSVAALGLTLNYAWDNSWNFRKTVVVTGALVGAVECCEPDSQAVRLLRFPQ